MPNSVFNSVQIHWVRIKGAYTHLGVAEDVSEEGGVYGRDEDKDDEGVHDRKERRNLLLAHTHRPTTAHKHAEA